ncbi:phosphotransferase [Kineococcus sp. DHX-1]|uniref:phosphotransferase n=1 Tax=Kineococcus sp. DHX-1 TaxID=3349638 RepID=UPI0036D425CD
MSDQRRARMHPDEVDVPTTLVRRLVDEQFPAWRGRRLEPLPGRGTENAVFALTGDDEDLLVRLPLRAEAAAGLDGERAAAGELSGRTRFATPEVVATGEPGEGFPFGWTVLRLLPGTPADGVDTAASEGLARDLAEFVRGVRALPLHGRRFASAGRGGDLHRHDAWVAECLQRSEDLLDVPALRGLWSRLRALPHVSADVVTHGDLVPGNLLLDDAGRLTAVLDVGGLGPADPALDLLAGWHLFDRPAREVFRTACGGEELDWVRGQAWAFVQAVGLVWYYVDTHPGMSSLGARTLARVLDDPLV